MVFHPNGRLVFAINELDSTIATYTWDRATGTLAATGASVSTLPAGFSRDEFHGRDRRSTRTASSSMDRIAATTALRSSACRPPAA